MPTIKKKKKQKKRKKNISNLKPSKKKNVLQTHLARKSFFPALEGLFIYGIAAGIRHHHVINTSSISGRGSGPPSIHYWKGKKAGKGNSDSNQTWVLELRLDDHLCPFFFSSLILFLCISLSL